MYIILDANTRNIAVHQFSSVPLQFVPKSCAQSVIVTQSQPSNTQSNNQSSIIKSLADEPQEDTLKEKQENVILQSNNHNTSMYPPNSAGA